MEFCNSDSTPFQCEYNGLAIITPHQYSKGDPKFRIGADVSPPDPNSIFELVNYLPVDITGKNNRVIVDHYAFMNSNRNTMRWGILPPLGRRVANFAAHCACQICQTSILMWKTLEDESEGTDFEKFEDVEERLLFLPPRLLGHALHDKLWGQFLVSKLKRVESVNVEPFETELQLDTDNKQLLEAFIKNHKRAAIGKDAKVFDIIEGKGQGLIIMLYGPPGVGKTLTAETIALATGRPLLTVTVAEIGTKPYEAEQNLTDVFLDASRWQAVLLMDEADVFVEERIKGDLDRNALVSVLLRCLEYYNGIVVLTTNRVTALDSAVQSRINLAIQYRDLTVDQRLAIYENRIKAIPNDDLDDLLKGDIKKYLKTTSMGGKTNKANGRQIRNIVSGALALAKQEGSKLTPSHLSRVDDATATFIDKMADTTNKQRAKNEVD